MDLNILLNADDTGYVISLLGHKVISLSRRPDDKVYIMSFDVTEEEYLVLKMKFGSDIWPRNS